MITPELIAEIRAALDAATPEPDTALVCLLRNHMPALLDDLEDALETRSDYWKSLVAQRKYSAKLTDEIERLRAELDRITNDRNNQLDRLRAAAGHAERLRARVAELEAEKKTWKNALEELTPGGSEFVDNPKRCADFVRAKIETMWKVIASRAAELEAERDEQNAVLREATQKLVELNVKNAVLKEKLRTAEDFNENYTVIDDIGPLPKCFHCAHQQSMAFRGPDAPCYQCGIDKGYPKFKADKP